MDKVEAEVFQTADKRLNNQRVGLFWIKLFGITVASALVALVQVSQFISAGQIQWHMIFGFVCAVVAGVSGVIVVVSDKDEKSELALASQALMEARVATREAEKARSQAREAEEKANRIASATDQLDEFTSEIIRAEHLYQAMSVMRASIEAAVTARSSDLHKNLTNLLEVAARPLTSAAGFETEDVWTICVYESKQTGAGRVLVLAADARAIKCERKNARSWPIGKGPAGISLANGSEVIVPDMTAPELGTIFDIGSLRRKHDKDHYVSIAAIPIIIGEALSDPNAEIEPWGVVVGTTDVPLHFADDEGPGPAAESIRALASMCATMIVTSEILGTISPVSDAPKGD